MDNNKQSQFIELKLENSMNIKPSQQPLYTNLNQQLSSSHSNPHEQIHVYNPQKFDIFGFNCTLIFFASIFISICSLIFINQQCLSCSQWISQHIFHNPLTQQIYNLQKLNSTSALCLDGTQASYYLSQTGDPLKILIFFQAGGWCGDITEQKTLENCYLRSKTAHGSSSQNSQLFTFHNSILAKNQQNYFKDWTKVYFRYCDGSGFQGTRKQPVQYNNSLLYFRGHNITTERFDDLQKKIGLFSKAKKVVLSGWSAGGLAVYTWAGYLGQKVKNGKVWAIPDAGLFLDSQNHQTSTHLYKQTFINLMKFTNLQIDPPIPQCVKQFPTSKQNCMFAQNIYKYIKVPIFAVQALYDSWAIQNILGVGCQFEKAGGCSKQQKGLIQRQRLNKMKILKQMVSDGKNGVWGISCLRHGILGREVFLDRQFSIPQRKGEYSIGKSIEKWIQSNQSSVNVGCRLDNIYLDDDKWHLSKYCG